VQKKPPDSWAVFVKRDLMVQRLCSDTTEENPSIFFLIWMSWFPSVKTCGQ